MSTAPKPEPTPQDILDQLSAEQGVRPVENFDEILGMGRDCWDSDEEFEASLELLRRTRKEV
jgi:hypothetical protein